MTNWHGAEINGRSHHPGIAPERLPNTRVWSGRRPAAPSPIRERPNGRGSTGTDEPVTKAAPTPARRIGRKRRHVVKSTQIVNGNLGTSLVIDRVEGGIRADGRVFRFGPNYAGIKPAINRPDHHSTRVRVAGPKSSKPGEIQ